MEGTKKKVLMPLIDAPHNNHDNIINNSAIITIFSISFPFLSFL